MKLMFASDLHGSLPATERVLAIFDHSGAQWLVLLGDLLNHGPRNALPEGYQPAAVASLLMPTRIALLPCAAIATVKSIKCYFNSPSWRVGSRLLCLKHVYS